YFRAVVQVGTCIRYSNSVYVKALPPGPTPIVTYEEGNNILCLGGGVDLTATIINMAEPENALPGSLGQFNQGQINPNNPDSWRVDGQVGGLSAGGNNTHTGNWSVTNPHRFGGQHPQDGIFMDSEEGKFAIAQGNITTILETPIMNFSNSDLSTISLDFDQAFYF